MSEGHDGARACVRRPLTKSLLGRSLCRHWYCFGGGGASALFEKNPLGHCVFERGVRVELPFMRRFHLVR